MLNEGVSKLAHPLFFTRQRSDILFGTVSETRYLQAAISSKKRQLVVKRDKNTIE